MSALDLDAARRLLAALDALAFDALAASLESSGDVYAAVGKVRREIAHEEAARRPIALDDAVVALVDRMRPDDGIARVEVLRRVERAWITTSHGRYLWDSGVSADSRDALCADDLERIRRCFPRGAK